MQNQKPTKAHLNAMRIAVIFEDSPEMTAVRKACEPEHLAYLELHRIEIPLAGGLREDPAGPYVGGLWVMEVTGKDRAVELVERDPYFLAFPRRYRLLVWGKALPQYKVML
jgi:uncharacterized protein